MSRFSRDSGRSRTMSTRSSTCPLVVTDDDVAGTFTFVRAFDEHGVKADLTSREIGETWLNALVERRSILWWGGAGTSTEHTAWLNLKRGDRRARQRLDRGQWASGRRADRRADLHRRLGYRRGRAIPPRRAARRRGCARQPRRRRGSRRAISGRRWRRRPSSAATSTQLFDPGLAQIPADSPIARVGRRTCEIGGDAMRIGATRARAIARKYGYDKYPGHCHVVPNHALMLMAILYAPDDFDSAQTIVCTSGWDTDCNAGNVGCLMGIKLGLAGLQRRVDWRGAGRRPDARLLRPRRRGHRRRAAHDLPARRLRALARRRSAHAGAEIRRAVPFLAARRRAGFHVAPSGRRWRSPTRR